MKLSIEATDKLKNKDFPNCQVKCNKDVPLIK